MDSLQSQRWAVKMMTMYSNVLTTLNYMNTPCLNAVCNNVPEGSIPGRAVNRFDVIHIHVPCVEWDVEQRVLWLEQMRTQSADLSRLTSQLVQSKQMSTQSADLSRLASQLVQSKQWTEPGIYRVLLKEWAGCKVSDFIDKFEKIWRINFFWLCLLFAASRYFVFFHNKTISVLVFKIFSCKFLQLCILQGYKDPLCIVII